MRSITPNDAAIALLYSLMLRGIMEAVKKYVGVDFDAITDDAEAVAAAKAVGVELADAAEKTWGNALYACFDQKVEEHLIQPTFITMYPVEIYHGTYTCTKNHQVTPRQR